MVNINDSVVVKAGLKDPDYPKYDIGGYQGRVSQVCKDDQYVTVDFDSITLKSMPHEYIASCFLDGAEFYKIDLLCSDVEKVAPRDSTDDVSNVIKDLECNFAYLDLDDGGIVQSVLKDIHLDDYDAAYDRWYSYLDNEIKFPLKASVFERTFHTIPLGDEVEILKMTDIDDDYGILCQVRHDRHPVIMALADLEVNDKKSKEYKKLEAYSLWYTNKY